MAKRIRSTDDHRLAARDGRRAVLAAMLLVFVVATSLSDGKLVPDFTPREAPRRHRPARSTRRRPSHRFDPDHVGRRQYLRATPDRQRDLAHSHRSARVRMRRRRDVAARTAAATTRRNRASKPFATASCRSADDARLLLPARPENATCTSAAALTIACRITVRIVEPLRQRSQPNTHPSRTICTI